jgi:aminoglycoside phosphotransferase (APT) family kinase protein
MCARRMHADEVETDVPLVRRLVAAQFPEWANLPVRPVTSRGTDNALYRLGADMVVRMPRRALTESTLKHERRWLPKLAPLLPQPVPVPLADGLPAEGYAFTWSIYRWVPGEEATVGQIDDAGQFAADLAAFIAALQRIDPAGGPAPGEHNFGRGAALATRDAATRAAMASLGEAVDAGAATAVWEAGLRAPAWKRAPVWIHGDLDVRNLLVEDGRLSGVIDWGCVAVGDPAYDVMVAWKEITRDARGNFRDALSIDDAAWARARGLVLSQALIALAYYTPETNPVLVNEARRWLAEVLADRTSGPVTERRLTQWRSCEEL